MKIIVRNLCWIVDCPVSVDDDSGDISFVAKFLQINSAICNLLCVNGVLVVDHMPEREREEDYTGKHFGNKIEIIVYKSWLGASWSDDETKNKKINKYQMI